MKGSGISQAISLHGFVWTANLMLDSRVPRRRGNVTESDKLRKGSLLDSSIPVGAVPLE